VHLKSVSTYFIFNLLSALVPIIALPVLTHYLSPTDYGIFTTFVVISMFIGNIFRLELNMALKREYVENKGDFSQYISTAFVFSTIMLVPYCMLALVMMPFIDDLYGIPMLWVFLIILLSYFRFQIINLHHLWQIANRALPYGVWGLVGSIAIYVIAISILFLKGGDWQARAVGEWLVGLASLPIAFYYLRKDYGLRWVFNLKILLRMLKYSLPLLPTTLMAYIFMVSDRVFISEFSGMHELGLYSVALQLAASVDLVFRAILPAWESWIFTKLGSVNQSTVTLIFKRLLMLGVLGGVMMLLLPPILEFLMPYLTDKNFSMAGDFLFPCLLAVTCAGFFKLSKTPLIFMRRTSTVAYINIVMIVFNFAFMYVFVSKWGAVGAAFALALTYTSGSLIQLYFMYKYSDVISERNLT